VITIREAFALGFAHEAAGRFGEARAIYEQILAATAEHPGALLKLGEAEQREGRLDEACALLERALHAAQSRELPVVDIWVMLGRVHVARRDWARAEHAFGAARALGCATAEIFQMLTWLALERRDVEKARTVCRAGLRVYSRDVELMHLEGRVQRAAGELEAAHTTLQAALRIAPEHGGILLSLGAVSIALGRAQQARMVLQRAIEHGQDNALSWDNLGLACLRMGDLDDAAFAFGRAVSLDPALTPALSNAANALRQACRWDEAEAREREWLAALAAPEAAQDQRFNPFRSIAVDTTLEQQLEISRRWCRHVLPAVKAPSLVKRRGDRLRIGYFSSDFRQHPMARLIARHLELHDRHRFEVFAYSHGPADQSAIRARVQTAVDHWTDVREMCNSAIAERIRNDAIDVLIDLNGHTQGQRLAALAERPAPTQVHYLGFPGTLGFDAIDGTIADAIVVRPGEDVWYSERILRMPRCYFVTDGEHMPPPPLSRESLGFAADAVVLASFNQTYKLTRQFFDIWLDVLREVPKAVLWIYAPVAAAQANLVAKAAHAGLDVDRVRFAEKVAHEEHLARLACADIALDLLPYGSHTTGVDALGVGVPMLSCRGTTFAGRVGQSLLDAVGLTELIADSPDQYRAQLIALASEPGRLHDYKRYLQRERARLPLFDTRGFTLAFEALLERAAEDGATRR
jgi:protein O-GlcNAc transferase